MKLSKIITIVIVSIVFLGIFTNIKINNVYATPQVIDSFTEGNFTGFVNYELKNISEPIGLSSVGQTFNATINSYLTSCKFYLEKWSTYS